MSVKGKGLGKEKKNWGEKTEGEKNERKQWN